MKPYVSACKPLCVILLARASEYPLSGVKANVIRSWENVQSKIEMEL